MNTNRMVLVAQHSIEGQYQVLWYREGTVHYVTYGASCERYTDSIEAARDFGCAVHHQAECDERIDP